MIEVQAKLLRDVVYVAGDSVECLVTFINKRADANVDERPENCVKPTPENLAWASAQIHCHCSVDEAKVHFPKSPSQEQMATGSKDTSFIPCRGEGEKGYVVFSSKPKILFCDLRLLPGESKSFVYRETIPSSVPPSYKGQAVRYAYKVTIGAQKVNARICLLRIPIKVFVVEGLMEALKERLARAAPNNPFLPSASRQSVLEVAVDFLEDLTSRRRPSYYNVTHQNGRVVRFCLLKTSFRLGEDIVGTFDFSEATVPCVQYSVTLQSEEEVLGAASASGEAVLSTLGHCKQHAFCLHLRTTHLHLPVPLHVTPSFASDIVELRWKLHFEFVMTTSPITMPGLRLPPGSGDWAPPEVLDVQTMVWDLPICLFPTHPGHVSSALKAPSQMSLQIC
ncbi:RAB6A-GEF complex partner protein 2-like isoform X1 [Ixodes scapularis]|uniref:RAB6A-GEF complex partner protein 2 isoform X1 n=1 Tax=Ixodes scapularis TaxID=6945 RepID=UPI001A9DB243|nr:RAB6A-GEF complex partner protein 2 isoform X1 [Ixodes scapularis]XP_042144877.1 RAB6A-GEF complex partner protein 2-like isoform X1 [Ixodes scapularis]